MRRQKKPRILVSLRSLQYCIFSTFAVYAIWHFACSLWSPVLRSDSRNASTSRPAECNATCVVVDIGKLAAISPLLHGLSLEETDHGIEGGLFVELLADRSFEAFAWSKEHPMPSSRNKKGVPEEPTGGHAAIKATADKITAATTTAAAEGGATLQQLSAASKNALHAAATHEQPQLRVPWEFSSNVRVQSVHVDGGVIGHSIIVQVGAAEGEITNLGHDLAGFPVERTAKYALRMRVRSKQADVTAMSVELAPVKPALKKAGEEPLATYIHPRPVQQEWQVVTALLEPRMSSKATKLVIRFKGPGALELDWVSLVPAVNLASPAETSGSNAGNARNAAAGTSKHTDSAAVSGTAAGAAGDAGVAVASSSPFNAASLYPYNRRLLSGLSELRPCFLRFPGAGSSASGLRWKGTVGLGDERPGHMSSHGPAYWSTDGIGLYEFMWLAEELGAEPVWVVSLGRGNSALAGAAGAQAAKVKGGVEGKAGQEGGGGDLMAEGDWLEDALDGLEFVLGPANSRWGAVRAQMGRPEPWSLKYVALESAGCVRHSCRLEHDRYARAIRDHYPGIRLLAGGDLGEGADFDIWEAHMLLPPNKLFEHARRALDAYQGKPLAIPKWGAAGPVENVVAAVAEAGLLSALERNCAKVVMQSRMHVLGREGLRSWPNLLVFDAAGRLYRTPSFHVQKLYRQYMGVFCAHVGVVDVTEPKAPDAAGQATTAADSHQSGAAAQGATQQVSAAAGAGGQAVMGVTEAAAGAEAGAEVQREARFDAGLEGEEVEGTSELEAGVEGLQQIDEAADSAASPVPLPHPTLESSATCLDADCEQLAVKVVNFGPSQRDIVLQVWDSAAAAAAGKGKTEGRGRLGIKGLGSLTKGRRWVWSDGDGEESDGQGHGSAGEDHAHDGVLIQLSSRDPYADVNSLTDPQAVAPETRTIKVSANTRLSLPPYSLSVLVVDTASASA